MAIIKTSAFIQNIRGSIGGSTFQRSRYGIVMRNKPIPLRSAKPAQLVCRAYMMQLHYAWQTMSQVQRNFWVRLVEYVKPRSKSGSDMQLISHALFLKYQFLRLICGMSLLTSFRLTPMPDTPLSFTLYSYEASLFLIFSASIPSSDLWFVLKLSGKRLPSQNYHNRGLRHLFVEKATTDTFDLAASYVAIFGYLPAQGENLHYELTFFSVRTPIVMGTIKGAKIVT